jgi:hypothetical protein
VLISYRGPALLGDPILVENPTISILPSADDIYEDVDSYLTKTEMPYLASSSDEDKAAFIKSFPKFVCNVTGIGAEKEKTYAFRVATQLTSYGNVDLFVPKRIEVGHFSDLLEVFSRIEGEITIIERFIPRFKEIKKEILRTLLKDLPRQERLDTEGQLQIQTSTDRKRLETSLALKQVLIVGEIFCNWPDDVRSALWKWYESMDDMELSFIGRHLRQTII